MQVIVLASSRSQPVNEDQAKPAIEQYLLNDRKRKLMEEAVKTLRGAAKVEYIGKFVPGAGAAPASAASAASVDATAASAATR